MKKHQLNPEKLVLRCMALQRKGYWLAMCIDLDLAVQADTAQKARELLKQQMATYVADALTIDSEHAGELLRRKAPLFYRAMYYCFKFLNAHKRKLTYEAAMPLVPVGA